MPTGVYIRTKEYRNKISISSKRMWSDEEWKKKNIENNRIKWTENLSHINNWGSLYWVWNFNWFTDGNLDSKFLLNGNR